MEATPGQDIYRLLTQTSKGVDPLPALEDVQASQPGVVFDNHIGLVGARKGGEVALPKARVPNLDPSLEGEQGGSVVVSIPGIDDILPSPGEPFCITPCNHSVQPTAGSDRYRIDVIERRPADSPLANRALDVGAGDVRRGRAAEQRQGQLDLAFQQVEDRRRPVLARHRKAP